MVGGFLLDRGFQVVQDAYPVARALLDKQLLDLRSFNPGRVGFCPRSPAGGVDMVHDPRHLLGSAVALTGSIGDKQWVALLKWRLSLTSLEEIGGHYDVKTEVHLQNVAFSCRKIDGFFRSFYDGIFLERDLRTSSRMFEFTFKTFSHAMISGQRTADANLEQL